MSQEMTTRFGPEALLVFVGYSDDAIAEVRAVKELENQLQQDLEDFRTAKNHDCRFSYIRIWEWRADASSRIGGQEVVITPELQRANIAVFVFKDRVGEVTWTELQHCRGRAIHVLALFPKQPSNPDRWNDIEYMKRWTDLLEKKRELTRGWTDPKGQAVTPLQEYASIQDLKSIVYERIRRCMAEIIRDDSIMGSEVAPPVYNRMQSNNLGPKIEDNKLDQNNANRTLQQNEPAQTHPKPQLAAGRDEDAALAAQREKLIQIINSGASIKERFETAEILGTFGDPRLNEDNFLLIPGDMFIRGSSSWEESQPERRIYLDDFWIGKYPVTNQEFKRFVEIGGYQTRDWWSDEGWQWREKERIVEPSFWKVRKWNGPNFPVVGVSWYESEAYTKWLSAETGEIYRLPTEAEWEKAARGTDGRKYPWGNQWLKEYCNSDELKFYRTSPVRIFLKWASPYGCLDMSGNVWEWCFDWYDKGYYTDCPVRNPQGPSNGSHRVYHGGSWDNGAESCAAACRCYHSPTYRDDFLGFRLVRLCHL